MAACAKAAIPEHLSISEPSTATHSKAVHLSVPVTCFEKFCDRIQHRCRTVSPNHSHAQILPANAASNPNPSAMEPA
jgi:hypothetical protein